MKVVLSCWIALLLAVAARSLDCSKNEGSTWLTCPLISSNDTGAVCLDGSSYILYIRPASSDQAKNKWHLSIQGGGWCYSLDACVERAKTDLGSTKKWHESYPSRLTGLRGIFDPSSQTNPDFYDWNLVYFAYCDGGSFSGNVDQPVTVDKSTIYFRGHRILTESLLQLQSMGMSDATHVLLSGMSAGGLATFVHLDEVAEAFPNALTVGIPDSGFFVDAPGVNGKHTMRSRFQDVFKMQNAKVGVDKSCIAAMTEAEQWKCFYATYSYPYISTPIFVSNPLYDSWQLLNVIAPSSFWGNCINNRTVCTKAQIAAANQLYLQSIQDIKTYKVKALFGLSCWTHVIDQTQATWSQRIVKGSKLYQAISKWYTAIQSGKKPSDNEFTFIDAPFPGGCVVG